MTKRCLGCGIELQTTDKNKLGYTLEVDNDYCERCFRLKNYGEYKSVSLTNDDYKKIIDNIPKDALVVYVTSLLNINLDYLDRFNNPYIILTKRDLLPKSINDNKLIEYIKNKKKDILDITVVSSVKNYNIDIFYNKLKEYGKNKEIYFIGLTNSGKSTLLNTLIKDYTKNISEVTTSIYPSTTLSKITVSLDNLKIIDTPGLLSSNSILNFLPLKEIKKVTPKKEIKPRSYQIKNNASLLIENIIRIDIQGTDNITIYLANNLNIIKINKDNNVLKAKCCKKFNLDYREDIVIEDLCFIKFQKNVKVDIYSSNDINIYSRNNLI